MQHIPVSTIGLDLAKNIFQVHGANAQGKKVFSKALKRAKLAEFFQLLPPCLVAMEACSGAYHWARLIRSMGHEVRLIAPQHVTPYVQGSKHDAADAAAICEAATRPHMRFVAIKSPEQQAQTALHCVRQGFIKQRTATGNQIRGLLAEFGLVMPQGLCKLSAHASELIEDANQPMPGQFRRLIDTLVAHFNELGTQLQALDQQIQTSCKAPVARQLLTIPGIGPISASALVASIGDIHAFKSGRELAAWLGLVPSQHSSGGKTRMQGISKRGDCYLRTLLVHGARSLVWALQKKHQAQASQGQAGGCTSGWPSTDLAAAPDLGSAQAGGTVDQGGGPRVPTVSAHQAWLEGLLQRRPANVATVALAAKNARIVWAVMKTGRNYEPGYVDARFAKA
jgi:transposase